MAFLKMTNEEAQQFYDIRVKKPYDAKARRKALWGKIKDRFGLPYGTKLKAFIEDPLHPQYAVLRTKHGSSPLTDGNDEAPAVLEAASPAVAKAANKAIKKAATKPAPKAKAAAPAVKATKTWSPVKTGAHQVEVRATIDGKRVRLGFTSTEAARDKLIATKKKEAAAKAAA